MDAKIFQAHLANDFTTPIPDSALAKNYIHLGNFSKERGLELAAYAAIAQVDSAWEPHTATIDSTILRNYAVANAYSNIEGIDEVEELADTMALYVNEVYVRNHDVQMAAICNPSLAKEILIRSNATEHSVERFHVTGLNICSLSRPHRQGKVMSRQTDTIVEHLPTDRIRSFYSAVNALSPQGNNLVYNPDLDCDSSPQYDKVTAKRRADDIVLVDVSRSNGYVYTVTVWAGFTPTQREIVSEAVIQLLTQEDKSRKLEPLPDS